MDISKNWDRGPAVFGTNQDPRHGTNLIGLTQGTRPYSWNPRPEIWYPYCIWCPRSVTLKPESGDQVPRLKTRETCDMRDIRLKTIIGTQETNPQQASSAAKPDT